MRVRASWQVGPWDAIEDVDRATEGPENNGVRTLVLATTGHRTGTPRRTCLIYGTSGGEYAVVAAKGGAEQDPAWFMNLEADAGVGVQVGTRRFTARACVSSSAERAALWARMVSIFPLYDDYAQKTDREIRSSCSPRWMNPAGHGCAAWLAWHHRTQRRRR